MIEYENWIGRRVYKKSGKPFMSSLKANIVKGVVEHAILKIPAFTFLEDESVVECRQCKLEDFLTLEDFLLHSFDDRRDAHGSLSWVYRYRLAKASFEQFGEAGPPVGAKVITLFGGHCGNGADVRKFNGDYDENYFELTRDGYPNQSSLVEKRSWWREIVSLDPATVGWGELPKYIRKRSVDGLSDLVRFVVSN